MGGMAVPKAFRKLAVAAAGCLAAPLLAQGSTTPAAGPGAADDGTLGEIVVTAQRREESLQDTPISVTARVLA